VEQNLPTLPLPLLLILVELMTITVLEVIALVVDIFRLM
jgi:hypothetical protein